MDELIIYLKKMIRVNTRSADEELENLVNACMGEMKIKGVQGELTDPLYRQVIVLYVKAHYGYDKDSEKFQKSYENLCDSMALCGEYTGKEGIEDGV